MTVITVSQMFESRAVFDRKAPSKAVYARRTFGSRSLLVRVRGFLFRCGRGMLAGVAILSILGIFASGFYAVKLVFLLRSWQRDVSALAQERETLRLQVSELARPDILAGYAGMLELKEASHVNYLPFTEPVVAQGFGTLEP